ncbi:unnamed protein product [Lactuca saligna]|uniref:Uncharacterized protein n=1 Tax=Lactuca saligna TaxID=75948 RepID=A0AA35YHI3_LACSI|nr:unnamed protein product [Lactuca saligna]
MADSLVLRGTIRAHTDWVTAIATPINNSDMIDTSSRDKLLNHKYDPLLEMRSFKAVKIMSSSYPKTPSLIDYICASLTFNKMQETTAHWPNFRSHHRFLVQAY